MVPKALSPLTSPPRSDTPDPSSTRRSARAPPLPRSPELERAVCSVVPSAGRRLDYVLLLTCRLGLCGVGQSCVIRFSCYFRIAVAGVRCPFTRRAALLVGRRLSCRVRHMSRGGCHKGRGRLPPGTPESRASCASRREPAHPILRIPAPPSRQIRFLSRRPHVALSVTSCEDFRHPSTYCISPTSDAM
jgi:hypothetical protein